MKLPSVKGGEIAGKAKLYAALLFFALAIFLPMWDLTKVTQTMK